MTDQPLETLRLNYAHLCDYAGEGARGKLILVGIFEVVFVVDPARPITMPSMYLAMVFEAHVADGTDHELELRLTDELGADAFPRTTMPVQVRVAGSGIAITRERNHSARVIAAA